MQAHREEYITTIFKLTAQNGSATNKTISQRLRVAPPSVTEMVRKLEAEQLVSANRSKITLTEEGRRFAEKILSKHRLWELFLQQVLDYSWKDVHEQARLLQYATSDHLMERLNAFLNYPPHCPHGGIIFINDHGNAEEMIRLCQAPVGSKISIRRIVDDKALLNYVERKGVVLGSRWTVSAIDAFDETVTLDSGTMTLDIAAKAADSIFVIQEKE